MRQNPVHDLIRSAASRSPAETRRLAERMLDQCWPGGGLDRTEPAARAWLSRWRPTRFDAPLPACRCSDGRCGLCN